LAAALTSPRITSIAQLHSYLDAALQLEHATIPPYLTALYSLHPEGNADARRILRVVVVEEMLHLTLVANILNAVGGRPDLTRPGFVPSYPTGLPDGETDFDVDLRAFSPDAVTTFLKIERPARADAATGAVVAREPGRQVLAASPGEPGMQYYSIGEFYAEIARGLRLLHQVHERDGRPLFTGDPARQVGPEYFYSGGGEAIPVTDLTSALAALDLIAEQGEGLGGGIYDAEDELSHYYRFEQLQLGRYYQKGDEPGDPTGPTLDVDYDAVYPVLTNARLTDYPVGSPLHAAAVEFNAEYARFLGFVTDAYDGHPELLIEAVWRMFRVRDAMNGLIRNPVPGRPGRNAAPTFELPGGATGGARRSRDDHE
jgi:Ferritin-like